MSVLHNCRCLLGQICIDSTIHIPGYVFFLTIQDLLKRILGGERTVILGSSLRSDGSLTRLGLLRHRLVSFLIIRIKSQHFVLLDEVFG